MEDQNRELGGLHFAFVHTLATHLGPTLGQART